MREDLCSAALQCDCPMADPHCSHSALPEILYAKSGLSVKEYSTRSDTTTKTNKQTKTTTTKPQASFASLSTSS